MWLVAWAQRIRPICPSLFPRAGSTVSSSLTWLTCFYCCVNKQHLIHVLLMYESEINMRKNMFHIVLVNGGGEDVFRRLNFNNFNIFTCYLKCCNHVAYNKVRKQWLLSTISIIDPKTFSRRYQYNYILNIAVNEESHALYCSLFVLKLIIYLGNNLETWSNC